ncbi:hypothetical protein K0M31_019893 [Melipona bicolor]|uniref:Uncharacterized protein n=1 Tax=Melipona bicolor TaxID=60889 RepID=A0AA40KQA6_9HYME|nr:hypothetical protein K0M31_019893 [Melipona bicolor]
MGARGSGGERQVKAGRVWSDARTRIRRNSHALPFSLGVLPSNIIWETGKDNSIIVKVEGDKEETKHANNQDGSQESDSDAETVSENVTEETPVRKKRRHGLSTKAK